MQSGKYFEEFEASDSYASRWKNVTETQLVNFLNNSGMIEPLFDDPTFREEFAGQSKQMIPGLLTTTIAYGFFTQSSWLTETGLALVDLRTSFEEPVFVGDDLQCEISVTETTPTSSDRGGIVNLDWEIYARRDDDIETVATIESTHFVRKRDE